MSNTKQVIKAEQININDITFTSPRANKANAGKSVYININRMPLRIQTPKMNLPFGVSKWDQSGPVRYNVEMSFNSIDQEVYNTFAAIEEKFLKFATDNSVDFFKKEMKEDVIKAFYTSSIRPSPFEVNQDNKYAPRLRCKLDKSDTGEFRASIWDGNQKIEGGYVKLDMTEDNYEDVMSKGCNVQAILSCSGWVVNGKFGLAYRVEQIKVFSTNNKLSGFAFEEDDEISSVASDNSDDDEYDTVTVDNVDNSAVNSVVDNLGSALEETSLVTDVEPKKSRGRATKK